MLLKRGCRAGIAFGVLPGRPDANFAVNAQRRYIHVDMDMTLEDMDPDATMEGM